MGDFVVTKKERILILCKTYPSPSAKYTETSCVAGMTEAGQFIRLYPVPFRMVSDERQFKKWQWITARVGRSNDDRRHESHRIFVDTIELGEVISSEKAWALRRPLLENCRSLRTSMHWRLHESSPMGRA